MKEIVLERLKAAKPEAIETIKKAWAGEREALVAKLSTTLQADVKIVTQALEEFCGNHAAPPVETEAPPATPPAEEAAPAAEDAPEWTKKAVKDWTDAEFDAAEDYLEELCANEYRYNLEKAHERKQANDRVQAYIGYADKHEWKRIDIGKARQFFRKGFENEVKEDEAKKLVRLCGKTPRGLYMQDVIADMNSHSTTWLKRQIMRGEYDRPQDEKKGGGERPFRN